MKKYLIFLIIIGLMGISACKNENSDNNDIPEKIDTSDVYQTIVKVYYSLPSPLEIASLLKKYNADFSPDILHSANEHINYTTIKAQAINLGIYSADLAFLSFMGQDQYAKQYFSAIIDMANKMDIIEGLNDTLINDVENNLDKPEKIKEIIAEAFFKSDAFLKENNRLETSTYILNGSWLESFYILCNIAENQPDTSDIFVMIIDQRLIIDNLIKIDNEELDNDTLLINNLTQLQNLINNCVSKRYEEVIDEYTDSLRTKTIIEYNYDDKKIEKIFKKISEIRENFISLQ
jgi:hypothetical protein